MAFRDIPGVLKLERSVMARLAQDSAATKDAFWVVAATSAAIAILYGLYAFAREGASIGAAIVVLGVVLVALFGWAGVWLSAAVYHLLAKLFGGRGSIAGLARIEGHAYALGLFALVPLFAVAVWIYRIVVSIVAVSEVERISVGRATAVVLLPSAIALAVVLAVFLAALSFVLITSSTTQVGTAL